MPHALRPLLLQLCAGFAMGMDNGPDWQLLIAILAHKWAESLTLAVSFVKENVSFAASIRMQVCVYVCMGR